MVLNAMPMLAEVKTVCAVNSNGRCRCSRSRRVIASESVRPRDAVEQDRELVAAHPCDQVVRPETVFQPFRYGLKKLISCGMAERIVQYLEVVQVNKQHCKGIGRVPVGKGSRTVQPARE